MMSFLGFKNKSIMAISSLIQIFWRSFCQRVATSGTTHQLLARAKGRRDLFRYFHRFIRKTLYLMTSTTYRLLEQQMIQSL
uniref:Similar to EBS1 (EMS-MUTAGENIZED BRI1 SUPPRESSOR 1) n=1 Tax=Arundo donax TaxID=35708 RepID=A0A0A9CKA5_ARUDO